MGSNPFLRATGFVPAPHSSSFGWSITTIFIGVIAFIAGACAVYYFFFRPKETNELKSNNEKMPLVDSIGVMANRSLV